jgi:hypothetical protein
MSQRHPLPALLCRRGILSGVLALAALLSPTTASAQDRPLFPDLGLVQREHLAGACVMAGASPQAGPWCLTTALLEGAHPQVQKWDFFGPLSIRAGRSQIGAATLFLHGFTPAHNLPAGIGQVSLLHAGHSEDEIDNCWTLIDTDVFRPLPKMFPGGELNDIVNDGTPISVGLPETEVYSLILAQAHYTSAKAFAGAARRDLTFAQIFAEPKKYRGLPIHIKGELGRLARHDPPQEALAQGVTDLYEAEIFYDAQGLNPFVVLFTDLPPQLRRFLGEKRLAEEHIQASFDGYFFKKFRAKSGDSKANTARDYPVFIGHSLVVASLPPAPVHDDWSTSLMVAFVGFVLFVVVGIIGLTWWFRRADDRARRRLAAIRDTGLVLPPPEADPEAAIQTAPAEPANPPAGRFGGRLSEFSGPTE